MVVVLFGAGLDRVPHGVKAALAALVQLLLACPNLLATGAGPLQVIQVAVVDKAILAPFGLHKFNRHTRNEHRNEFELTRQ